MILVRLQLTSDPLKQNMFYKVKVSVKVMQQCQNALQNQHLCLTINVSNRPRVNVHLGQVVGVQTELHIDGLPVRLQAAFKKAGEMEAKLMVRWKPANSTVLGIL